MEFLIYTLIGAAVVWGVIALIAAYVLTLLLRYLKGLVRAIRFVAWAYKNSSPEKKQTLTRWILVKNVFYSWHEMTWGESVSYTAPNGSSFGWSAKNGTFIKE